MDENSYASNKLNLSGQILSLIDEIVFIKVDSSAVNGCRRINVKSQLENKTTSFIIDLQNSLGSYTPRRK